MLYAIAALPILFVPTLAIATLTVDPAPGYIALINLDPCCAANLNPYPTKPTPLILKVNSFAVSIETSLPLLVLVQLSQIFL